MNKAIEKIKMSVTRKGLYMILLLAAVLRFNGLTKRDFWYDEAFTGVTVKENFSEMIAMTINDVHPPLYYILVKGFASFFGYSVFGIRLFSAIVGILCVLLVYFLAKEIFNKKVALLSALLTAISPFAVQYSQEARMYTLLSFFILLATYFFIKALKTERLLLFVAWGVSIGLAMLTHYMGIIYSITFVFLFLYKKIFNEGSSNLKLSLNNLLNVKRYYKLLLGYFVSVIVFLPWLPKLIQHLKLKDDGGNLGWVKQASLGDIIFNFQMFLFGTPVGEFSSGMPNPNQIAFIGDMKISHLSMNVAITILITVATLYLIKNGYVKQLAILAILSIGFLLIIYSLSIVSEDQQYFVARYLFPAAYFLFMFLALFLASIKPRFSMFILVLYIIMLLRIVPLVNSQSYNEILGNIDKYKGKNFYVLNSFDYVIAKYYFGEERLILFNNDWPQYNPASCWPKCWAAIGPNLKRTENYSDMQKDPKAIILTSIIPSNDTQNFKPDGLEIVDKYQNLMLYKFK